MFEVKNNAALLQLRSAQRPILTAGEAGPFFTIKSDVNPAFSFGVTAGRWVVLAFLGNLDEPGVKAAHDLAVARTDAFDPGALAFFGVVARRDGGVPSNVKRVYFFDNDLAVARAYGAVEGEMYRPMAYLLDRALRVVKAEPLANLDALLDLAERLMAEEAPDLAGQTAPVMTLPNIFEPGLCERLMAYYEERGGEVSGFMREVAGQTVLIHDNNHKRRKDVLVEDELMRAAIRQRIERRLLPMIERSFGWRATQIERYLVACYGEEDSGFFRAHRDNTTAGTAHRKFAVSINLNADYDGGLLRFPEFGPRTYKPPVGGATVFSCSLLHEATPVTRGYRYAFLPFLYDDDGAKVRAGNLDKVKLTKD